MDMIRPRRGRGTELRTKGGTAQVYTRQGTIGEKEIRKSRNSLRNSRIVKWLSIFVPGSLEHMAVKKAFAIAKRSTLTGVIWDILQVVFSILACAMYVSETYVATYSAARIYNYSELIVTQFFMVDFLLNWFVAPSTYKYFKSFMTMVDVVTIAPVYVSLALGDKSLPNLSLLRFFRILRLIRILRTFRLLGGVSGIRRQIITLSLTLLSLTFMAAGVVQVMENDVKQLSYECQYINEFTNYEPSCDSTSLQNDPSTCDCDVHSCSAAYVSDDARGRPSYIRCNDLPYFNCFYFIVVTMATVGYGDISPTTGPSKVVIILFIITSLIVIPMQVNKLTLLLSLSSAYRSSYAAQSHENHVIVCGHVNDAAKLERLFKEFFHPGRHFASAPDFHLVVMAPSEPPEEVRALLVSPLFDSRVTYIIGSALSTEDLQRSRADVASAIFFVCNVEVQSQEAFFDDAATVLRTLSVNNFNKDLTCLVQVLRPEDRDILKDSDVDVVLCLDEFKTAIQARNAICPGMATFIENMFHTFSSPTAYSEDPSSWLNEYLHGARMEMYFVSLERPFLEAMNFDWDLLVEAVYVEYGRILTGVCNVNKHAIIFNPGEYEMRHYFNAEEFFSEYSIGILMATSQEEANSISANLSEYQALDRVMVRMLAVEEDFAVRRLPAEKGHKLRTSASILGRYSLGTARVAVESSFKDIISYSKMNKVYKKKAAEKSGDMKHEPCYPEGLGMQSLQVIDASKIVDHVIVFGCVDNVHLFVHELRRPLIQGNSYRPIVIVSEMEPLKWSSIASTYRDVYFIENSITTSAGFNASNVRDAFAIVLLASRDSVTMVEEENLDAETLFSFLKLERYVPRHVFFTVELTCSNNMSVLNSTIMRRSRDVVVNTKKYASRRAHDAAFNITPNVSRDKSTTLQHSQVRGTFSSQRKVINAKNLVVSNQTRKAVKGNPGRRISSIHVDTTKADLEKKDEIQSARLFWDLNGTHHVLPVFAAGRSYVPSVFDSLLCQSFYSALAPLMCERIVCGQGSQTICQEPVPKPYFERTFVDLFRAFRSRGVQVLGLYRSSRKSTGSALPYVFTCPWARTELHDGDMVYLFGHPKTIGETIAEISQAFLRNKKGNFGLACSVNETKRPRGSVSRKIVVSPSHRPAFRANADRVASFASKQSLSTGGEDDDDQQANAYQPRQHRLKSKTDDDDEITPPVERASSQNWDPSNKAVLAVQAIMRGYLERKRVKEKYDWEIAQKNNVKKFLHEKHVKQKPNRGHDVAAVFQKNMTGHRRKK